jgi:hypothetical protein
VFSNGGVKSGVGQSAVIPKLPDVYQCVVPSLHGVVEQFEAKWALKPV